MVTDLLIPANELVLFYRRASSNGDVAVENRMLLGGLLEEDPVIACMTGMSFERGWHVHR